ncbi:hypothetical protein EGW08_006472 [Elysia chlorotica]|uniref:Uncharacterized protein n=1 Tax=Elysia chlorotica TaxID=188477 RepID=A0A433TW64_ELYCH|nr:hypothetical protein EGW08_006472 [Elysia chlorotica]
MGFGQKQEHRYGQRPPPARRPYRENIPNSWKGDPTVNRRPRLDYRSNLESVVQPPNFVPSQPTQVLFSGNPHDVLMSGSPVTHWNSVFPVHAPPGIYPGQDQYGPPGSYVQYIPVNLTPVQQTYPSLALTESSPQVYNSPQLVQSITTLAMQNNFGVNKDVSPAFLSPGYSDAAQAMPEIHQNGVKYDMVWAGAPQPIQPKSAFQYGQQHQPQMVSSHPNVVNPSQAWSVPDPDLVRVMNSANQQHMKYSQIHSELHEMDAIKSIAFKFVEEFCPQVSNTSYCHPPVLRSRHSEKASKQLMMGMESEQRVIGTFERYFAASQIPAFILCHYPLTGFLQEHHKKEQ